MASALWLTVALLFAATAGLEAFEDEIDGPKKSSRLIEDPIIGVPVHIIVCGLPPEEGPCKGYFKRYYFDASSGRCRRFIYGGCRGNYNNFKTKKSCEQSCLG